MSITNMVHPHDLKLESIDIRKAFKNDEVYYNRMYVFVIQCLVIKFRTKMAHFKINLYTNYIPLEVGFSYRLNEITNFNQ